MTSTSASACLFFSVLFLALGVPTGPAFGQGQPQTSFPSLLSQMTREQFAQWLVGTKWEFENGEHKREYWFASPMVTLYSKKAGEKPVNGFGYRILELGEVNWANSADKQDLATMKVNSFLNEAAIDFPAARVTAKLTGRSMPAQPPGMDAAAFQQWLMRHELVGEKYRHYFTGPADMVSVRNGRPDPKTYVSYQPGAVVINTDGVFHGYRLFILSPDLKTFIGYGPWAPTTGKLRGRVPDTEKTASVSIASSGSTTLQKNQATANALLVTPLGNSEFAGTCSKLSVTALKVDGEKAATLTFNQSVGKEMTTANREVLRFLTLRHGGWPQGFDIKLAFADKYSPKDGPSAATACAVLLESLITGKELDPQFAMTGDLNADGSVQPVGGIAAKIRGAGHSGMRLVAIPEKNRVNLLDVAVLEGVTPFLGPQILSVATFDDAWTLAQTSKPLAVERGLVQFSMVIDMLRQNPASLRSEAVTQALKDVTEAVPNHVSAKVLQFMAADSLPKQLSPAGSLDAVDRSVAELQVAANADINATSTLDGRKVKEVRMKLQTLKTQVDARVHPYIDAWMEWAGIADQIISRRSAPAPVVKQLQQALAKVKTEAEKLMKNREFTEQLMK